MKKRSIFLYAFTFLLCFCLMDKVSASVSYCEYKYDKVVLRIYNQATGDKYLEQKVFFDGKDTDSGWIYTGWYKYGEYTSISSLINYQSEFGINDTFKCKDIIYVHKVEWSSVDGNTMRRYIFQFTDKSDNVVDENGNYIPFTKVSPPTKKLDTGVCNYTSHDGKCNLYVTFNEEKKKASFSVAGTNCNVSYLKTDDFLSYGEFKCPENALLVTDICPIESFGTVTNMTYFHIWGTDTCSSSQAVEEDQPTTTFIDPTIPEPNPNPDPDPNPSPGDPTYPAGGQPCGILGTTDGQLVKILSKGMKIIRLAIPILIIGLGIFDFIRILASGEEKTYKESFTRFVKRLAIGILFFFIPYLLKFILNLSGVQQQYNIDNFFCGLVPESNIIIQQEVSDFLNSKY